MSGHILAMILNYTGVILKNCPKKASDNMFF